MAKMFYTIAEAASKLGMDEAQVQGLIDSGQLQEFRNEEEAIVLKVDQVDLLAGDDEDDDEIIPLADSGDLEPIGLSASGSQEIYTGESTKDSTGISIFDPDADEEEADPAAQTQISPTSMAAPAFDEMSASGSGLANLALESDDTSLGADLLDDVYGGDDSGMESAAAASAQDAGIGDSVLGESAAIDTSGDLFEATSGGDDINEAPAIQTVAAVEIYDGTGSGLVAGLTIGMSLVLMATLAVIVIALSGATSILFTLTSTIILAVVGGAAAVMLIAAALGFFLMK